MLGRCELGKPLRDALVAVITVMIRMKIQTIKETSCAPWARPNGLQEAQTGDGAAPDPFQPPVTRAEYLPRVFTSHRAFPLPTVCPDSPSLVSVAQDLFR